MSLLAYVVMRRARGSATCGYPTAVVGSEELAQKYREAFAALRPSNPLYCPLERTFVEPVPFDEKLPPAILEMAA